MAAPTQMTAHTLDGLKGWPSPHAVDFQAKLSANVTLATGTYDYLPAGRVVHLNSSGEYETGITGTQMAIFTFQNSNDYDVANDGGIATDVGGWVGTSPSGGIGGLVAVGAYELESTEFDADGTYVPNTILTADSDNTDSDLGGKLSVASAVYAEPVCGVCSRAEATNSHGVDCIYFWPVYLPATP